MFPTLPAQFESVEKGPQTWGNLKVSCLISALGTAQKAQTHGHLVQHCIATFQRYNICY